ncbi:MAG: DUF4249 domain-containing protein [Bacteroidia bacterium]|nr:DUF4249 domain-containing protein [Bacteroidia bacterium]
MFFISALFMWALGSSCEKQIDIKVPASIEEIVVEASINQRFGSLNYVVITKTIDYFKPDLSLNAVSGATVYITEGNVAGTDTFYDVANRRQFIDLADTLLPGIYINPSFMGKAGKPYLLEIALKDGRKVNGKTFIPVPVVFDSIHTWFEKNNKDTNAYFYLQWKDGPEQNNYRMALWKNVDSNLTGWGIANRFYTFDDEFINNTERPFQSINPYRYGDTLNIYLSQIGRKEFIFWNSFRNAANNGGPFATPVSVTSNINGAIGSFTGYGIAYKQLILR